MEILLVDDSKSVLNSLKRFISVIANEKNIDDYNIQTYTSYADYLKGRDPNYDLAIIDWNLPDGKGKDVVKNLNGDCKYKSIYTGMVDDNMEIGSYCIDNNIDYIPKGSGDKIRKFIDDKLSKLKEVV